MGECSGNLSLVLFCHACVSPLLCSKYFLQVLGWRSLTVTEKSCEPPAYCKAQGVLDRDGKRLQLPKMCLNHSRKYSETRDSQDSQCMGDQSRQALCSSGDES